MIEYDEPLVILYNIQIPFKIHSHFFLQAYVRFWPNPNPKTLLVKYAPGVCVRKENLNINPDDEIDHTYQSSNVS